MSLNAFQNTFAGNPLDRVSEYRKDAAWLAERLASDQSLGLVLWNGKALVERSSSGGTQIAYLPSRLVEDLSGGS
jgi:NAD+ diphosphatase